MKAVELRVSHLGATAVARLTTDGVLIVRVTGSVTELAVKSLRAVLRAKFAASARAVIVDYSGALLALDGMGLWHLVTADDDPAVIQLPVAFVVGHEMVEPMVNTSLAAGAARGLLRVVRPSVPSALEWARAVQLPCY